MEKRKIINRLNVRITGEWYEINDHEGTTLHHGSCAEGATPREVYERHYPPNKMDGVRYVKKTLFYISDGINGFTQAYAAKADLAPYAISESQEGYLLIYVPPRVTAYRNTVRWNDRPRIIVMDGRFELPDHILYDIEEQDGVTVKKSKFTCHDAAQLDAVIEWLDANGYVWKYM